MAGYAGTKEFLSVLSGFLFGKRMIVAKSQKDLEKMRAVGELIAEVRETLRSMVEPGVTTLELNAVAEKMMRDAGAIPTFIGYKPHGMIPFPFAICASVMSRSFMDFRPTFR
jgi:methionine aminopeptidase